MEITEAQQAVKWQGIYYEPYDWATTGVLKKKIVKNENQDQSSQSWCLVQ